MVCHVNGSMAWMLQCGMQELPLRPRVATTSHCASGSILQNNSKTILKLSPGSVFQIIAKLLPNYPFLIWRQLAYTFAFLICSNWSQPQSGTEFCCLNWLSQLSRHVSKSTWHILCLPYRSHARADAVFEASRWYHLLWNIKRTTHILLGGDRMVQYGK